ncbi:DegT/DnrJ/EryC1/StrS family aminotransferase [Marinobacter algicola]|uniref:DegT/DnrJ/EryC1/StrS family aminotransferase n=1 Tax=Marinobacter algicola TaxID=236100 RepID=UPI003BAC1782
MKGKLRPVGSPVPFPRVHERQELPWAALYRTEFMGSGTEALSLAVAIAIRRHSKVSEPEVIIPAYGCPDLVSAIVAQGARPILVDLLPNDPRMNDLDVREAITPSTVAVVGVGFLGISERLEELSGICREHNLLLIEDSAQCFPPASAFKPDADLVVLSFGRGKPINLMGGGALLIRTDLAGHAEESVGQYPVSLLKVGIKWLVKRLVFNLLMRRWPYYVLERMPFLGIGETRLHKLDTISRLDLPESVLQAGLRDIQLRPLIHQRYDIELGGLEARGWKCLASDRSEIARNDQPQLFPLLRYPVLAPSKDMRDRALAALNSAGIGASAFYGCPLPQIDGVAALVEGAEYPMASDFAWCLLTLPTHEGVTPADVALTGRILFSVAES